MEDDEKIFRAWLKKVLTRDKIIKGKILADKLGIGAPTLTGYHSGRIINGERIFPAIPFEIRKSILGITKTSYDSMLEIGRSELNPQQENLKETVRQIIREEIKAPTEPIKLEPYNIINLFKDRETAIKINKALIDIERVDPYEYEELAKNIELRHIKILKKNAPVKEKGDRASGEA